jgi:hypothetical protein
MDESKLTYPNDIWGTRSFLLIFSINYHDFFLMINKFESLLFLSDNVRLFFVTTFFVVIHEVQKSLLKQQIFNMK